MSLAVWQSLQVMRRRNPVVVLGAGGFGKHNFATVAEMGPQEWQARIGPRAASLLALSIALAFMVGYYLMFTARRMEARPEDRPDAEISDAYIGPYSSIGAKVVIENAEVEHSIILPGASIKHLGGRLEASVVGPGARIFRDFRLPRALRLNVGEGAEIALT